MFTKKSGLFEPFTSIVNIFAVSCNTYLPIFSHCILFIAEVEKEANLP